MVVFFPRPSHTSRRNYPSDSDDDDEAAGGGARYYYVRRLVEDDVSSDSDDEEEDDRQSSRARDRRRRWRRNRRARRRLILEVVPDDYTDDEEEEEEESDDDDDWDPWAWVHLLELPLRPMSRFQKAFIDVLFVVATVAMEGTLVFAGRTALGADKAINWIIAVPVMLPITIPVLCFARFLYLLATSDFSWRPAPAAPADENV